MGWVIMFNVPKRFSIQECLGIKPCRASCRTCSLVASLIISVISSYHRLAPVIRDVIKPKKRTITEAGAQEMIGASPCKKLGWMPSEPGDLVVFIFA